MIALQRPDLDLHHCELQLIAQGLDPMRLPSRFVEICLERFDVWRRAPRIATFGAELAPESIVGPKIAKLVAPMPTWTLVSACDRKAAWRVHDWALAHFVPVKYVGEPRLRMTRLLSEQLVQSSDHLVVFEQRKAKRFDFVLQLAKQLGKKISLELYDGDRVAKDLQLDGMK
jgi:hypothetical protein